MRIAVDFDGTIVEHAYPNIGKPVPGAIDWLIRFQEAGAQLILWTMRSGETLKQAVDYCATNGVILSAVNEGIDDREWTTSPKAYAHLYIDDAAFNCPLLHRLSERPMVDWGEVGPIVLDRIIRFGT